MSGLGSPRQLASWLLDQLRVQSPSDIDVTLLAQLCNATIISRPLRGSDARILGRGDRAYITVDDQASLGRRRFSAAHELGHWLYDREQVAALALVAARCSDLNGRKRGSPGSREVRADKFAAELLLPLPFFQRAAGSRAATIRTFSELAQIFRTSFTAAAFRFVDIDSRPTIYIEFNPDGQRCFFRRHADLPDTLWPKQILERGMLASQLSQESPRSEGSVDASLWFDHASADGHEITESSQLLPSGQIRTILSWENDEAMLLAI